MIEGSHSLRGPLDLKADVCVVGAGAAGAVVADRLVRAGARVVVLEEGGDPQPPNTELEARATRLRDHGLQATADRGIQALQGCLLGGGSAVGHGVAWRAPDTLLTGWAEQAGATTLAPETMLPAYDQLERDLGLAPRTDLPLSPSAAALAAGCDQLGWETIVAPSLRRLDHPCDGCGRCALGCQAVPTARQTQLDRVDRAGAPILGETRVVHIDVQDRRADGVMGFVLVDGAVRHRVRVRAEAVVLTAGALHSSCLLQASRVYDPHRRAGACLRMQPTTTLVARFDEEPPPAPGACALTRFADGLGIEPDGLALCSRTAPRGELAATLPLCGDELDEWLRAPGALRTVDVVVRDRCEGWAVPLATGRPVLRYELLPPDRRAMARGLEHAARALLAAGAAEVLTTHAVPTRLRSAEDLRLLRKRHYRACDLAVHSTSPVGTCAMGVDPETSVVDARGRVHGVTGLYVADASVLPEPVGLPAGHTVAALAGVIAAGIEADLGVAGA